MGNMIADTLMMAGLACLVIAFLEATVKMYQVVIRNLYREE